MNNILDHYIIAGIELALSTAIYCLLVDLISKRAKVTIKKVIQCIIWSIIVFMIQAVIFNDWEILNGIFFIGIVILCFLFNENELLTKIWKVLSILGVEGLIGYLCNIACSCFPDDLWSNWFIYYFSVSIIEFLVTWMIVRIIKKFNLFKTVNCESIVFSKAEGVLLCILGYCVNINSLIALNCYDNLEKISIGPVTLIVWSITSIISLMALALGIDKNIAQNYYLKVNELIKRQFKRQVTYYEKIEESHKEIREIKHDMKNHLIAMQGLLQENKLEELEKYIHDIRANVESKMGLISTGNTIVDSILNEKYAVAHEKQIHMEVKVGVEGDIDMEFVDLCIILSNSIDNAIEACERIEDPEKRKISIQCNYRAGYFLYEVINTMKEERVSKLKNKIETIKKDKKNHGFGIGNIKKSVRKYDGDVKTNSGDFQFILQVEINTKAVKALQA
ncbi:sensor histidine kinase [Cellulosilyticum ruminicola]|uniref:sensor histidine kinase n=1 Tax=Cellulosilyticum ruminicola TaxID=425254 RepID=UPI0006D29B7C|nr:GHKL domain-containing protein [Cellulosilyticum ruminicola]